MEFRPHRLLGVSVGSGIVLGLLTAAAYSVYQLRDIPISFSAFGFALAALALMSLAGLFAYWTFGCWSLSYRIDRNCLTISWTSQRQVIPLSLINGLALGKDIDRPRGGGVHWPGYHVGSGRVVGIGKALFYSAHRTPKDLVYVLTPELAYGISVPDPGHFARELELRQRLGATHTPSQETCLGHRFTFPAPWITSTFRLLGLGLLLNIALFGYVGYMYPDYPQLLPFNFSLFGRVPEESSKTVILFLPFLGLALLLGNTALSLLTRRARLAHRLFLVLGVVIQPILVVAALRIPSP
ncbi:MAG: hypothetical protein HYX92_07115 [Chloroflexi bacterium]|nr:hypothetical protein [Chloroflexota bacterium]